MTETLVAAAPRYKVRFPDADALRASQAVESPLLDVAVINHRRAFISVAAIQPHVVGVDVMPTTEQLLQRMARTYGADIVVDTQYWPGSVGEGFELPVVPEVPEAPSLHDVLDQVNVPAAWGVTRGAGAVIAIVDTGIAGSRPEFPSVKRLGQWSPAGQDAWTDDYGHGTMCACIATATSAAGGEFDGVAPEASLLSCRTGFLDSELTTIFDFLGDFAEQNGVTVVASNSWGYKSGESPPARDDDFPAALEDALQRGVIAVFSAGNYHKLAGGAPDRCDPTSIWEHKCWANVMTVANSAPDGTMWSTSSRGPGQLYGQVGSARKPDVNAPTPPYGRVLWGDSVKGLPEGWGTSGACPQVAGLVALALASGKTTDRDAIFAAIRDSAVSLGLGADCQGTGRIDCAGALARI